MDQTKLGFVSEELDAYCIAHSNPPSPVLNELEKFTRAEVPMAQMLTGSLEGAFLGFLCRLVGAKRALEFGTYTGYSALSLAEALPDDGEVYTLDIDEKNTALAKTYWQKSPHGKKIKLVLGPARETIRSVPGEFDLVFIDADKGGYIDYFEAALAKLSPRGVIVADNTLFSGEVLAGAKTTETGKAIQRFNERVNNDPKLDRILLPVRDGIYLIRPKR